MTITIHAQGAERKRLVQTISDWLGVPAKYCGAPTFNYEVDYFTIDRDGSLPLTTVPTARSLSGSCSTSTMRALTSTRATLMTRTSLAPSAFPCRRVCSPTAIWKTSRHSLPPRMVLSRKPLGVDDLPLEIHGHEGILPLVPGDSNPDEMKAYDTFICKLCEMARNQSRVNSSEKTD